MEKVFVYEKHNEVLEAWAQYRRTSNIIPNLITLDHHTDVLEAFCNAAFDHNRNREDNKKKKQLLGLLNYQNDALIKKAIASLRNDEHIDAAIRGNIIRKAFVISHDGSYDKPNPIEHTKIWNDPKLNIDLMMNFISLPTDNLTYPESENGIYIVSCSDLDEDMVLDSEFLNNKLDVICAMNKKSIFDSQFILDIDLDYFHKVSATQNGNMDMFYRLIEKSEIITIAKESTFVDQYKSSSNKISSEILLEKIMEHIKKACNFA